MLTNPNLRIAVVSSSKYKVFKAALALDIPHLCVRQQGDQVPAVAHQVQALVPRLSPAPPAGQGAQQQSWVIRVINRFIRVISRVIRVINRVIRVIRCHPSSLPAP